MLDGFIKVAALSPAIRVGDVAHNAATCLDAAQRAARDGARVIVLPELCLTGATCGDLFWQDSLHEAVEEAIGALAQGLATDAFTNDTLVIVGAPLRLAGSLYDCAVVLNRSSVLGIVAKQQLSAAEARYFAPGPADVCMQATASGAYLPFGAKQIFVVEDRQSVSVAVEFGSELSSPVQPAAEHTLAGATIVASLSAAPTLVGRAEAVRVQAQAASARLACAYVYASAGTGESTTDYVFGGQCLVAENGKLLAEAAPFCEGAATTEVDVARLASERRRSPLFQGRAALAEGYRVNAFAMRPRTTKLSRAVDAHPFIPDDEAERAARCEEILGIQAHALAGRMRAINSSKAVIGISGGLDSTLALLVTARAFDLLGLDRAGITAITMPGFGTTDRTHNNAWQLTEALGATPREIAIGASVRQHFADIGHDESLHNAAYENAQARERTQILMDVANDIGGLVVGTGDLSELCLGWATYNGDHMSMYAVNAAVPKTLIRYIVRYVADTCGNEREAKVLLDVLDTPVSPELLPANADGSIAQQTEDLVGPYELHDFFAYHLLRWGSTPSKVYRLAQAAFAGAYDDETILKWLRVFYRRFFAQQFKRSCSPDGPAVGSVGLSPRGGLMLPSDASSALFLAKLEELPEGD